ncbi:MAG TPA: sulfatase [Actinomycetota bacterium]|nr:sulfatase [Actinomycetota bacterium]
MIGLPNVLIIVTDDQRGGLGVMPQTRRWFAKDGTRFARAFATTPVCCPSRASIFTGRYAHNHGVKRNPQAEELDQFTTIQSYLKEAGYRTAISGKYLNKWDLSSPPPFFDRWAITASGGYYNAEFNVDGVRQTVPEYSTTFIRDYAVDRIEEFELLDPQPWFLYVATWAPHGPNHLAEPRYEDAPVSLWKGNPAVRERDLSDKPPYVRSGTTTLAEGRKVRRGQFRTLMSVDDLVDELFETLSDAGELDDTLAFFVSDNGFMWGEHGLRGKVVPYRQSVSIPMLMRWPGEVPAGVVDRRLVGNIDIAPTIVDAVDLVLDPEPMDGRSLLGTHARKRILLEAWGGPAIKRWRSLRTDNYAYTEYYPLKGQGVVFREYYRNEDRWELTNLFGDGKPANDPGRKLLHRRLKDARSCAGTEGPNACP